MGQGLTRSYREEWIEWGITTSLQTLLMYMPKEYYSVEDLMSVARMYGVEEQLLHRMSYVPDDLESL